MNGKHTDMISPDVARTLPGLFRERVARTPNAVAYRQYDANQAIWLDTTWVEMAAQVRDWANALAQEGLIPGDRVGIMLPNCREWVLFDQAAMALGLVVVPIYPNDRPDNCAYILQDANVRLLLIGGEHQWERLAGLDEKIPTPPQIISIHPVRTGVEPVPVELASWLDRAEGPAAEPALQPDALATIIYTSGTTGRPKGVMLSHANILSNAHGSLELIPVYPDDLLLSFLPLSHTFERTIGYYLPIMGGATVAYARSISQLAEDLRTIRPTLLISVPRVFERIYNRLIDQVQGQGKVAQALFRQALAVGWHQFQYQQGRFGWHLRLWLWPLLRSLVAHRIQQRFGGRLRLSVCGGAPLPAHVGTTFLSLGVCILQGYGLTETSPVVSSNLLEDNDPTSVGFPLPGVRVRVDDEDEELLVAGPNVMLGYWQRPEATNDVIDADGWLHTGDCAQFKDGRIYITGRLKEIIVLANGEKAPPADMELAITQDPLIEQVMVLGEGRPYLAALVVLNPEQWAELAKEFDLSPDDPSALENERVHKHVLQRIGKQLHDFPGYAQIRRVALFLEPWTIENGLLTPTLKPKRENILGSCQSTVSQLYAGH